MKFPRLHTRRSRGFVLIMVVLGLALMMILLLALFQGILQQSHGAAGGEMQQRDRMLADTAAALVIGQIQQASSRAGEAWISQPGLLRTYAADASRKPTACYKLYSTPNLSDMIDKSGSLTFLAGDVPSDWNSKPALYTDLNAPARSRSLFGSPVYPILDPAAASIPGIKFDSGRAEMPVAWIYQLQDGTLGPASAGTAANPIVARFAFWTDDDTSKININTAGCGTPWNTPRGNSTDDVAWSKTQPAAGEYSAYPGHPATTSLGVAFSPALTPQQLLTLTPRYAWGGSEFGAKTTTSGQNLAPKTDRLYSSIDELCFSTTMSNGQRAASVITPDQINAARFVLTAHSEAPETTLLGAPRVAIWPIADAATKRTANDLAIINAATVGTGTDNIRNYYFQRNSPLDPMDDFNPATPLSPATDSNLKLFNELVARGQVIQPGYAAALSSSTATAKYSDANWRQIILEITDFIHGLNPVDPNPAIVPFAGGGSNNVGRAFIVPLTMKYGTDATQPPLRGFGRCPTLQSLTLVFYVCGYRVTTTSAPNYKDIDYTATPDTNDGADWLANFPTTAAPLWSKVKWELIRAFVVPSTFQPGCGFPEVSNACDIQIDGLDKIQLTNLASPTIKSDFQFASTAISRPLSDAQTVLPAERAWGGNEGPLAWRAAANAPAASYPFAGKNAFVFPIRAGPAAYLPAAWANSLSFNGVDLTVTIRDPNNPTGTPWQTLNIKLPAFTIRGPTANGECDYSADPAIPNSKVLPSYYMSLANRIRAIQWNNRGALIQVGDISRGVEAKTDQRLIAGLNTVPSDTFFFSTLKNYTTAPTTTQGGSHAHNLRLADGTSACFAPISATSTDDWASLVASSTYTKTITPMTTSTDWQSGAQVPYNQFTGPNVTAPTGSLAVTMNGGFPGDWDTAPGLAPDGALINLPDAGTTLTPNSAYQSLSTGQVGASTQRTPNALVPSPVIFGSLPTGINPVVNQTIHSKPWQTLLFCPYPAAGTNHPGAVSPPDHLILDNFWMPVVEPLPISTCMATAGKINLNDQIAPFTYIHRNTALRAVLDSVRIPAVPLGQIANYKSANTAINSIWNAVDMDATMAQIDDRFANKSTDAYLSESEICTVPLVPAIKPNSPFSDHLNVATTKTELSKFWNSAQAINGQLTGDNLREQPYAQIYSRLTTRSNSYTVHIRAQVLKKLTHDPDQNVWKEGTDVVLSDWRGSYEIERYLDPDASAPKPADPRLTAYKFRIISAHAFQP